MSMKKSGALSLAIGGMADPNDIDYDELVKGAYSSIGRSGLGSNVNQIDPEGYNYWLGQLQSGAMNPTDFSNTFNAAVSNQLATNPQSDYSKYISDYMGGQPAGLNQVEQTKVSDTGKTEYVGPGTGDAILNIATGNTAATSSGALNPINVLALGDSTTWGYNSGVQVGNNMVTSAQNSLGSGYNLSNMGVNSTAVSDLLNSPEYQNALNSNANIVTLNYGMNEAYRGVDPNQFKADLLKAVNDMKAAGKTVVLQTPNVTSSTDPWAANVGNYAQIVRDVANETGAALHDKYAETSAMGNATSAADPVHPTEQTYGALGLSLAQILSGLNSGSSTSAAANASPDIKSAIEEITSGNSANAGQVAANQTASDVAKVSDYRGQQYDPAQVLNLAKQVSDNFDISQMSGGVFGTTGESVGFNYEDALKITGNSALSSPQQVALDMARYLIDQGITDISQIGTKSTARDVEVQKVNVVDDAGNITGQQYQLNYMPDAVSWMAGNLEDPSSRAISRTLTPEEIASLRTEKVKDPETGIEYDRYVLPEFTTNRLSIGDITGDNDVTFGSTYTGPGGTMYRAFIDPATGQVKFTTMGQISSDLEVAQPFLTLASFVPVLAPFARLANAAIAIDQGNTLGGLAGLAGLGEFSNVAAGLNAANAIVNKDPFALVSAFGATEAGRNFMNTEIADGYTNRDAFNVARTVNAINQGNLGAAVSAAADLSHSEDAQKAAAGFNLVYALQSGNPYQISNAMGTFLQNVAPTQRTRTASDDSQRAYVAAVNAGATEEEAAEIARIFSGPEYAAAGTGTMTDAGPGVVEVTGAPIFAESRNAGSVRPPPGYTLMSSSEIDSRPAGSYYDNILNAWLKPTGGFESINEMLGANQEFDAGSIPEGAPPITGRIDEDPYTVGNYFGESVDAIDRLPGVSGPVSFDQRVITGGREPANLDQVTVTGSPGPANLDQVVVTAPAEPANLDQVVVTAPPEPANLDRVVVTAPPEPANLEQVVVTAPPENEPADLGTVTVTAPPEAEIPPSEEESPPTRTTSGTPSTGSGGGGYMMIPPSSSIISGPPIASLAAQMLQARETQKQAIDPLALVKAAQKELERELMLQNLDPRLLAVLQQRMQDSGVTPQGQQDMTPQEDRSYYAYGTEQSIDDILGNTSERTYKDGGYVAPLMAQGGMALPLLAKSGGALDQVHRGGREDFKEGKHVAGEGDGQSDDIPAWLADGEFVFPADVVSALGNGSTKAGTDKLYEMMHNIRDRARSKGPKDLPPPALKSPLDYLKSSKRSAQ